MSTKATVDILFKEHSFEEIESVRDNLASEIKKRTDQLKSIIKDKYRDVLETSDVIQSMKLKLNKFENSIHDLDKSITKFHTNIVETNQTRRQIKSITASNDCKDQSSQDPLLGGGGSLTEQLLLMSTEMLDHFDSGNLKISLSLHDQCLKQLDDIKRQAKPNDPEAPLIASIRSKIERDFEMIKNHLWHRIQSAEPNQIGIIASGRDEQDLYTLSLELSLGFLVDRFRLAISDLSFQAQIHRYEQYSFFNMTTNTVDSTANDGNLPEGGDYVQIPKDISPELSRFLFELCRVINTIAGFSLSRATIIQSLRLTLERILRIYTDLAGEVDKLNGGSKRRRALQLYFDLMYLRVLLNTAKDLELIEELDSKIFALMSNYELMLDTIELYIVSEALHTNVLRLSNSTMRLYSLLVPYLQ